MPNYKLTYFNMKGRGELIRYIFAYMNAEYKDIRIERGNWPAIKPSIPYGKLPVLEVDGVILHQSLAIGRYLARKAGLSGKTDLDDAHIDALLDSIDDFIAAFPRSYKVDAESKKKQDEFLKTAAPPLLDELEKSLGDKQWFVGDSVSLVDFYWDTFSEDLECFHADFAKDYHKLQALKKRVRAIPAIAAWIKRRPITKL
ncbi:hematopoietic prostaglandin D synthase-like [Spea bombifrons]|uniref:hematopoietic prostaglandin D synthase-like n=1 Tax=Spea bombifrons TaxID=233779 RepID=UPI00234991CB|nr:hematopoietic prostaglandin D synthase-like [Spea bombifrons]